MRIVSLLPSATEILCELGLRDQLVAVSHECDYPTDVASLPRATSTVIDSQQASADIDRDVRAHLARHSALYSLNVPVLERLQPDLFVTQALCDVCAVSADEVNRVACALPGQPVVLNLEPMCMADVYRTIREIGRATDTATRAEAVCQRMQARIAEVCSCVAERARSTPRVAFLEWVDPPFNGGHWTPELIRMAGGIDMFAGEGQASITRSWEEVVNGRPDVLFVACCGYDTARARADVASLAEAPGWSDLPCVRTGRVYIADGNQFFNRPGPRLADSLEILAAALHPDIGLPDPGIWSANVVGT